MTNTYYYGVMCAGEDCEKFIAINEYTAPVRFGLPDVNLGDGDHVTCLRCHFRHACHNPDLVYSQRPGEMVPLDDLG